MVTVTESGRNGSGSMSNTIMFDTFDIIFAPGWLNRRLAVLAPIIPKACIVSVSQKCREYKHNVYEDGVIASFGSFVVRCAIGWNGP